MFFRSEHNARIHLAATLVLALCSCWLGVSTMEAIALLIVTALVWMAELFNTALEKMVDFTSHERKRELKYIKDLSAAAVLVTALAACATGILIFLPKLLKYV